MRRVVVTAISLFSLAHAEEDWSKKRVEQDYDRMFSGKPEIVSDGHQFAEGMAFDADGNFYFTDVPAGKLFKVDKDGKKTLFDDDTGKTNGIAMSPDGMLYGCAGGVMAIHRWDLKTGEKTVIAKGAFSNDIAITKEGRIFFTDPKTSAVWTVSPAPEYKLTKAVQLEWKPNGIGLNHKKDALLVAEFFSDTVHNFPIREDNSLGTPHEQYQFIVSHYENGKLMTEKGLLDGMVALPSGNLIIGTSRGIQLTHPLPTDKEWCVVIPPFDERPRCNYVRISPDGKWLYAAFKDDIVRIPIKEDGYIK